MILRIFKHGKKIMRDFLGLSGADAFIQKLYREKEYLEAYREHTDIRVELDPHAAVGGKWEEIGQLQFEFLIERELKPHHRLLDIGCGTLRAGRHFIKYLHVGNYAGIDISPKAIDYGKQLVKEEGLTSKKPCLIVSGKSGLRFNDFSTVKFDYLIAHSVFTHLKAEHIHECFENIGTIMHSNSLFYFTYRDATEHKRIRVKEFYYPPSFFESLAARHQFSMQDCSNEYNHPRGQKMIELPT
jgi:cyclopropane fatty-acyl-phospholipid synthase-like methyltransferase